LLVLNVITVACQVEYFGLKDRDGLAGRESGRIELRPGVEGCSEVFKSFGIFDFGKLCIEIWALTLTRKLVLLPGVLISFSLA
jgi:hypothetical protein